MQSDQELHMRVAVMLLVFAGSHVRGCPGGSAKRQDLFEHSRGRSHGRGDRAHDRGGHPYIRCRKVIPCRHAAGLGAVHGPIGAAVTLAQAVEVAYPDRLRPDREGSRASCMPT